MIQKIKNNQQDYQGFLFIITLGVALVAVFLLMLSLGYVFNSKRVKNNYDECKITSLNAENNLIEYTCKNDLKIIDDLNNITKDDWSEIKETFHCKYTGHDAIFECDNNIKIKKRRISLMEWNTFRDENHCRLVKIDDTASENKYYWSCDNNINISNDFYK